MKIFLFFAISIFCSIQTIAQGVSVSETLSNPHPSSILDLHSTSKGLLVPRLSELQRDSISNGLHGYSPALSLLIYNTTTHCFEFWALGNWHTLGCAESQSECGGNVTFLYKGVTVTYGTIFRHGLCWMDRNLGATGIPTTVDDPNGFGDLFQWGRAADGHQDRNSDTTQIQSLNIQPSHAKFITTHGHWHNPFNIGLWQGANGVNNPCPSSWRLPTVQEIEIEQATWNPDNKDGAFSSPLKWTINCDRRWLDGEIDKCNRGWYWLSTIVQPNDKTAYFVLLDTWTSVTSVANNSSRGYAVRCVKD